MWIAGWRGIKGDLAGQHLQPIDGLSTDTSEIIKE